MEDRKPDGKLKKKLYKLPPLSLCHRSQDVLPKITAKYGMYIVEDGAGKRYIKLMDIRPIPFYTMPVREQNRILTVYENWFRIAPKRFGIYATTSDTNKDGLIQYINESTVDEPDKKVLMERNKYVNWIRNIAATDTVSRKIYLCFQYERDAEQTPHTDEEIAAILNAQAKQIADTFAEMGLQWNRSTSESNGDLYEILYRYLNRSTCYKEPFYMRYNHIRKDAITLQRTKTPQIDPRDYYAPTFLDNRYSKYLIMDGKYYTFLFLRSLKAPLQTAAGWLDGFTSFGSNVSLSVTFEKQNREMVAARLEQSNRFIRANIQSNNNSARNDERRGRMSNNKMILDGLQGGDELWKVVVILSISADTLDGLIRLKKHVVQDMRMSHLNLSDCTNRETEAMQMMLPILYRNSTLSDYGSQTLLSRACGSTFMFTDFVIDDPRGAVIGIDNAGRLITLDPFDTKSHINANGIIVGMAGSGKTYAMNTMLRHLRLTGLKVRMILPVKGRDDYYRTTQSVGGVFIQFAPGAKSCVNLFEIRPEDDADESMIYGDAYEHRSLLAKKLSEIKTWLVLRSRKTITEDELNAVDAKLTQMYRKFGITEDNETIREFCATGKPFPTFQTFYDDLEGDAVLQRVRRAIRSFVDGPYKNLNGQTNVDLENKWVAFDVDESVCGEMIAEYYYIAMTVCLADAHRKKTELVLLFYDEVQRMTRNPETAKYIDDQYATLRGYGAGIWCATQQIGKLQQVGNGEMSKTILSNAGTKVIMKTDPSEVHYISSELELSPQEERYIQAPGVGSGLILTGGNHTRITFRASQEEFWLFNTDPEKAKEREEELKANRKE